MFHRLSVRQFKSLDQVDVDLGRVTVLVGQNGAGKTSLLAALHALTCLRDEQHPFAAFQRAGPYPWQRMVTRAGSHRADAYALAAWSGPHSVQITVRDHDKVALDVSPPVQHIETTPFEHPAVGSLPASALLRLDPDRLRDPSFPEGAIPEMGWDGSGLASRLAWLAGAYPDVLEATVAGLRQVVPGIRRVRTFFVESPRATGIRSFDRAESKTRIGHRLVVDFDTILEIPASELSDGTLLMLGLMTKLHDVDAPELVLCDDIDRGLHIGAQFELAKLLHRLLEARPSLQLVCTTHSPYLASQFEPSQVLVMALDEQRHTHVARLDEHPEFEKLRYGFQTGELWAALGEGWVIDVSRKRNAA